MGRCSQILGEAFERWLCATSSLPALFKIPHERNRAGKDVRSVWLDFVGATESGAFVTYDAKAMQTPSRVSASILRPSQRIHADNALRATRRVAVVVGWPYGSAWQVAVIPWDVLRAGSVDPTQWIAQDWCKALEELDHG